MTQSELDKSEELKRLAKRVYDIAQPFEGKTPFGDLVNVGNRLMNLSALPAQPPGPVLSGNAGYRAGVGAMKGAAIRAIRETPAPELTSTTATAEDHHLTFEQGAEAMRASIEASMSTALPPTPKEEG